MSKKSNPYDSSSDDCFEVKVNMPTSNTFTNDSIDNYKNIQIDQLIFDDIEEVRDDFPCTSIFKSYSPLEPKSKFEGIKRTHPETHFPSSSNYVDSCCWEEKYRPLDVTKVPMHMSKKRAIEAWLMELKNSVSSAVHSGNALPLKPKVLLLYGPSGTGKSTTLGLLCQKLAISSISYTDHVLLQSHLHSLAMNGDHYYGQASGWEEQQRLQDFIVGSKYPPLQFQSQSGFQGVASGAHNEDVFNKLASHDAATLIVMHDPIPSSNRRLFDMWWTNLIRLQIDLNRGSRGQAKQLGVALIVSDSNCVTKTRDEFQLTRAIIPSNVLDKIQLTTVHVPPATLLQIKKILTEIDVAEANAASEFCMLNNDALDFISHIADTCNGDIRQSIVQFQLYRRGSLLGQLSGVGAKGKKRKKSLPTEELGFGAGRDTNKYADKLLGVSKLLHIKLDLHGRYPDEDSKSSDETGSDGLKQSPSRPPEEILGQMEIDSSIVINLLQHNSIQFIENCFNVVSLAQDFLPTCVSKPKPKSHGSRGQWSMSAMEVGVIRKEIEEMQCEGCALDGIASALDSFSDVDIFSQCKYNPIQNDASATSSSSGAGFPNMYIQYVGSRSVSVAKGRGMHAYMTFAKECVGIKQVFQPVRGSKYTLMRTEKVEFMRALERFGIAKFQDDASARDSGTENIIGGACSFICSGWVSMEYLLFLRHIIKASVDRSAVTVLRSHSADTKSVGNNPERDPNYNYCQMPLHLLCRRYVHSTSLFIPKSGTASIPSICCFVAPKQVGELDLELGSGSESVEEIQIETELKHLSEENTATVLFHAKPNIRNVYVDLLMKIHTFISMRDHSNDHLPAVDK